MDGELLLLIREAAVTRERGHLEAAGRALVAAAAEDEAVLHHAAATLVTAAVRGGSLGCLDEVGLLSLLAGSNSSEARHVAALAYAQLGDLAEAVRLQSEAAALEGPVESPLDEDERLHTAIENYRRLGSSESLEAALALFVELAEDSTLPYRALTFVEALDRHGHVHSAAATRLAETLATATAEQSVLRSLAFLHWRRGELDEARRWQQAALFAPESQALPIDFQHELALFHATSEGRRAV